MVLPNLRLVRRRALHTQTTLAKRAGLSQTLVSQIERGLDTKVTDAERLAAALEVAVDILTGVTVVGADATKQIHMVRAGMIWVDVDGARDYLGGRDRVSRKTVYAMVKAGMQVAPRGDSGKRFWFSAKWIDEFLMTKARR